MTDRPTTINWKTFLYTAPRLTSSSLCSSLLPLTHITKAATNPASPANPNPACTTTAAPICVCVACAALGVAEKYVDPALGVTTTVLCNVAGTVIDAVPVKTAMLVLPVATA